MEPDFPPIERGGRGHLHYDKAGRAIVSEFPPAPPYRPIVVEGDDILESLVSSAVYMDEKARDRFVVTAEALHGAIDEILQLRRLAGVGGRHDPRDS